jgi:hypothetical protein
VKRSWRIFILFVGVVMLLTAAWLWWNRPQRAEMAAYVPQDSLIYFEADSLPEVLSAIGSTDAWHTLAPAVGVRQDFTHLGWLTSFARWTGIGSAESVVFSRAQVAIAILGVDAKEERDLALNISPRLVVAVETHTSESRTRRVVEQIVGDFARRAYGDPKFEQSERSGAHFAIWSSPTGSKKIVAAVAGSAAFIGNDEAAVQTCFAAWRGERASLAGDPELAGMRRRVGGDDALAFGYVPQASAPKLTQIAALVLAGSSQAGAHEQSALAIALPQLASRVLGGASWSAKIEGGEVEDNYYFALPSQLTTRLSVALETSPERSFQSAEFLPADAHQITRYNFAEPYETWRGVNAVISSQLDPTFAPFAAAFLDKSLQPFGIDSPRDFLRALGSEVATVRLGDGGDEGDEMIFIGAVRDEAMLHALIMKRLGARTRTVHVGDADMLVSPDAELGAASLFAGHVILGSEQGVRRCLETRFAGKTIATSDAFKKPLALASQADAPLVTTFTDEREKALRFVALASRRGADNKNAPDAATLARAVASLPYSLTISKLKVDGVERTTISPFGLLADIALKFSPEAQAAK